MLPCYPIHVTAFPIHVTMFSHHPCNHVIHKDGQSGLHTVSGMLMEAYRSATGLQNKITYSYKSLLRKSIANIIVTNINLSTYSS